MLSSLSYRLIQTYQPVSNAYALFNATMNDELYTLRYDTLSQFNVDWNAECGRSV